MRRACGAIAVDGRNACGAHGYSVAARLGHAQNTALRHCYQHGGKDCVIRAWACDAKDLSHATEPSLAKLTAEIGLLTKER